MEKEAWIGPSTQQETNKTRNNQKQRKQKQKQKPTPKGF